MQFAPTVSVVLLTSLVTSSLVDAASVIPPPTGPLAVGRTSFFCTDAARPETATDDHADKRQVRVDLWYPADADANAKVAEYFHDLDKLKQRLGIERILLGAIRTRTHADAPLSKSAPRYPLLILSPGGGCNATYYTALIEDLVSHGYVVAAVDHPYQSRAVLLPGGTIAVPAAEQRTDDQKQMQKQYRDRVDVRARDMIFVLDQLVKLNSDEVSPFRSRLDLDHVGVLGHSIGGVAAPEAARLDSRFKAAVNIDGHAMSLPFFPYADGKVLRQPFMELTDGPPPPPSDEQLAKWKVSRADFENNVRKSEERLAALMRSIAGGGYRVILRDAKHDHFSDTFLWLPGDLETRHRTVKFIRDYTRAFFDKHLGGRTDTLLDAAKSPYDEITVERYTPAAR